VSGNKTKLVYSTNN